MLFRKDTYGRPVVSEAICNDKTNKAETQKAVGSLFYPFQPGILGGICYCLSDAIMKLLPSLWHACLLVTPTMAENGLTGLPAQSYDPLCAMACVRSLDTLSLSCSTGGGSVGMVAFTTSTECWAANDQYLISLAYCMRIQCARFGVLNSKLESFWELQATGQSNAGVRIIPAKWSFSEALEQLSSPPEITLASNAT